MKMDGKDIAKVKSTRYRHQFSEFSKNMWWPKEAEDTRIRYRPCSQGRFTQGFLCEVSLRALGKVSPVNWWCQAGREKQGVDWCDT